MRKKFRLDLMFLKLIVLSYVGINVIYILIDLKIKLNRYFLYI